MAFVRCNPSIMYNVVLRDAGELLQKSSRIVWGRQCPWRYCQDKGRYHAPELQVLTKAIVWLEARNDAPLDVEIIQGIFDDIHVLGDCHLYQYACGVDALILDDIEYSHSSPSFVQAPSLPFIRV